MSLHRGISTNGHEQPVLNKPSPARSENASCLTGRRTQPHLRRRVLGPEDECLLAAHAMRIKRKGASKRARQVSFRASQVDDLHRFLIRLVLIGSARGAGSDGEIEPTVRHCVLDASMSQRARPV